LDTKSENLCARHEKSCHFFSFLDWQPALKDRNQVKMALSQRICGGSQPIAADEVRQRSLEWMCGLEKR
jgi:hypothetical protein